MSHFADILIDKIQEKGSPVCVGLDPRLERIPSFIKKKCAEKYKNKKTAVAEAFIEFNKGIIDAVHDLVPIVKPQIAFYEQYGSEGMRAFEMTAKYARQKGLLVLADAKRNDIGSTAQAYADAFLGEVEGIDGKELAMDVDALTVTPYLGWDGIKPFMENCRKFGKGIFVLVKTSNPSSGDLQDLEMADGRTNFQIMGHYLDSWGSDDVGKHGYSFAGAVVGATFPDEAKRLRQIMPQSIFLVPGYGAQGGGAEDVKPCFNEDGLGALINSSRGIIFAYEDEKYSEEDFGEAARAATEAMRDDLATLF